MNADSISRRFLLTKLPEGLAATRKFCIGHLGKPGKEVLVSALNGRCFLSGRIAPETPQYSQMIEIDVAVFQMLGLSGTMERCRIENFYQLKTAAGSQWQIEERLINQQCLYIAKIELRGDEELVMPEELKNLIQSEIADDREYQALIKGKTLS